MPEAEVKLDFRKKGTIQVAKSSRAAYVRGGFKVKEVEILPSSLEFKRKDTKHSTRFLLAPLGYTEIVQVKEDLLVLVSTLKREELEEKKKVWNDRTWTEVFVGAENETVGERVFGKDSDLFKKQLTLKFKNREDREDWMKAIIAECDRNYLIELIDERVPCSEKFIMQTNEEIWKRILSEKGDEPLRYAYVAAPGTNQLDVVRRIVAVTVEWIQKLLDIPYDAEKQCYAPLKSYHKESFTALFSLLVEDNAARAFFFLLRPGPKFLEIYKEDSGAGMYDPIKETKEKKLTEAQKVAIEKNSVCLSLIKHFRERMQDAGWKQFRVFLSVVEHPSYPDKASNERSAAYSDELKWMKEKVDVPSVINWFVAKNALRDAPYLSYFFIQKVIENVIDDQSIRRVLLLMKRLPADHIIMPFEADRAAKPMRKHFESLRDYCKYREMWQLFNTDKTNEKFFGAVHIEIWSRIALKDDATLINLFLPTELTHNQPAFHHVLAEEILKINETLREQLGITEKPGRVRISASDSFSCIESFRTFVNGRLTQWVMAITGSAELRDEDVSLYVDLLTASAKSSIVRAVLWLVLPVSVTEGSSKGHEFSVKTFCSQFISVLEELTHARNKAERFLAFLALTEHPVGKSLSDTARLTATAAPASSPAPDPTIVTANRQRSGMRLGLSAPATVVSPPVQDLSATGPSTDEGPLTRLYSQSKSIVWKEEADWMNLMGIKKWVLSWSELKLMLNDTPYFAFQVLIRRFQEEGSSYEKLLQLVQGLPDAFKETSFEADIDMCGEARFGSKLHVRTALHFRDFVVSRKVIEIWNCFQTASINVKEFKEEVQNQLLFLLVAQRDGSNRVNGFHSMMTNLGALSSVRPNSEAMTFETIIPLLLKNHVSSNLVLKYLFNDIVDSKTETFSVATNQFQRYVEHIATFCQRFYGEKELNSKSSPGFAVVFSACLGSMTVRAMLAIMSPILWEEVTSTALNVAKSNKSATVRLTEAVDSLLSNRKHPLTLYLLKLLDHPGVKEVNHSFSETAVPWEKESEWITKANHDVTLLFDEVDFTLLGNPAYLLFRYICRHFHTLDSDVIHSTVDNVDALMPPRTEEESFSAQLNYFPCSKALFKAAIEPTTAPHFAHLRKYSLFHKMWNVQLSVLAVDSIDQLFRDAVIFKLWTMVSGSGGNHKLINVFAPSNSAIHWDEHLTYLVVLQRFAILTIHKEDPTMLPKVCQGFATPEILPELNPHEIDAHHILMKCILVWVHKLLDATVAADNSFLKDRPSPTADQLATLFVEFVILCFNDIAVRTFVTAFIPSPSTIEGFMNSILYKGPKTIAAYAGAATEFVKLLARTMRDEEWMEFRFFMKVLKHPVRNGGMRTEQLPLWADEAKWIIERQEIKPGAISWQEFEYMCTKSPYVLLLTVTKGLPEREMQTEALNVIPAKYMVSKFKSDFVSSVNRVGEAPHFVAMCLNDSTNDHALKVFQDRSMISDGFFESVLNEACIDINSPRLLQVYNLLQIVFLKRDGASKSGLWNVEMLKLVPNLSSVLITFLYKVGRQEYFKRDEMIIGCIIMLVLQLEASKYEDTSSDKNEQRSIVNACTFTSEWMHTDKAFVKTFFDMLENLQFTKWFSRLCVKLNSFFGVAEEPVPETPEFDFGVYEVVTVDAEENYKDDEGKDAKDVVLSESMQLTKNKLCLSILGFFNLCVEFRPEVFNDFIKGLGNGRPFFSYFMHKYEMLSDSIPRSLCRLLDVQKGSDLYQSIVDRMLFYDNDHTSPTVIQTMGLRHSSGASINLTDSEFTDLLCVAMYAHDCKDLKIRFENVVVSLIADQERREMTHKVLRWIVKFFVKVDTTREHLPTNTEASDRVKWKLCEKLENVTFEDIIECAAEAKVATHLLRSASRSNSYETLEKLFVHYVTESSPKQWKELFRESKTIAYFIKYVDAEDLCLAYSKFFELNGTNKLFKNHLLQVRRRLTRPIVSGQELVQLTSASGSEDKQSNQFFDNLNQIARELPKSEIDLKMVYRLTSAWMKISKEKVLFPLPPRNAQIITLLTVAAWGRDLLYGKNKEIGKALIAQVGTGEGKSLIIAMTAIYFVVALNKKVHILENNPGLLEKDVKTMRPLYAEFGIMERPEGTASEKKRDLTATTEEGLRSKDPAREFTKFGVTYTLRRNVERYYQQCIMEGIEKPLENTVLIVDEVDDLIVDECPNQPYAASDCDAPEFHKACAHFKINDEIPDDKESEFIWELTQITKQSAEKMVPGEDYEPRGSTYVGLEGESGRKRVVNNYDYRLEYLKYASYGTQPAFKSTFYYQSVPYMLQQYSAITGFSGSLGSPSEREFLTQQYKVWCFDTPSFLNTCTNVRKIPAQLMDDPELCKGSGCVHVYDTTEQQLQKIVSIALANYRSVPVLIIARSTVEAYQINDMLKKAVTADKLAPGDTVEKYLQMFMQYKEGTLTLDNRNWSRIVQRATAKKKEEDRFCITVTDPFGGRGHDFDMNDDEVDLRGGLAVIMSSIPTSDRELRQWKGRTARKDNRGQYAVVLCSKDSPINKSPHILKDYEHKYEHNQQPIPNVYKEEVITKLLELQDEDQYKKLMRLEAEIAKGKRLNRLCDQFYAKYDKMKEESWPANEKQRELRDLLTLPAQLVTSIKIDQTYASLGLLEHDIYEHKVTPPIITSSAFWNDEEQHQEEWDWLAQRQEALQKEMNQSTEEEKHKVKTQTPVSKPKQPAIVFETDNPLTPHSSKLHITVPKSEEPERRSSVKERAGKFETKSKTPDVFQRRPSLVTAHAAEHRQHSSPPPPPSQYNTPAKSTPAATPAGTPLVITVPTHADLPPPPPSSSESVDKDESFDDLQYQHEEDPRPSVSAMPAMSFPKGPKKVKEEWDDDPAKTERVIDNTMYAINAMKGGFGGGKKTNQEPKNVNKTKQTGKAEEKEEEAEEFFSYADLGANQPSNEVSSGFESRQTKKVEKVPTPPPAEPVEEEVRADVDDLVIASAKVKDETDEVKQTFKPVEKFVEVVEEAYDKAEFDRKMREMEDARMQAERDAAERARLAAQSASSVDTANTTNSGLNSGISAAANFSNFDAFGSGVEAANTGTGISATTARDAMVLSSAANKVAETKKLTNFAIGDQKKILLPLNEEISNKLSKLPAKTAEPLTVGVYDITGPNSGNGVVGLEVTGSITKSNMNFTIVFQAKVNGNQYNVNLYGPKRFEAKWKEVVVFAVPQVEFEPALAILPYQSYILFNAKDGTKITTRGNIVVTSRQDPRSTNDKPFFPDVNLAYAGSAVSLPSTLQDAVITLTPDVPGYLKATEKCLLYKGKKNPGEKQVNVSPADLVGGQWRVILTWGDAPRDLDLYCMMTGKRRIYFAEKNAGGLNDESKGNLELDKDVTNGKGPETLTFIPSDKKHYRFLVHNYSNELALYKSKAKIVIVNGSGQSTQIDIPTDIVVNDKGEDGRVWHVFDMKMGHVDKVNKVILQDLRFEFIE